MEREPFIEKSTGSEIKNCRYCPLYGQTCDGRAADCLCLRCPRNLGQCVRVRYCRETESILDFSGEVELVSDTEVADQLEQYFKRME